MVHDINTGIQITLIRSLLGTIELNPGYVPTSRIKMKNVKDMV